MSVQEKRRRRGRRIEDVIQAWTIMLMFTQLCVSSTIAHSSDAISRKLGFFHGVTTVTSADHSIETKEKRNGGNELYDEDKRLVHTGPNPLHN